MEADVEFPLTKRFKLHVCMYKFHYSLTISGLTLIPSSQNMARRITGETFAWTRA